MERRGLVLKAAKGPLATLANCDRQIQSRDKTTVMDRGIILTRPEEFNPTRSHSNCFRLRLHMTVMTWTHSHL